MIKMATVADTAKFLGVSKSTLRRWEREGRLLPDERTTIAYARVSSHDPKADLERQGRMLEMFGSANGWSFEILSDRA